MATREAFLIAAQQVNDPIMVVYGAETPPVACYFDFRANRGAELNETGQTPDEAVARLWLALHRNGRQQL